jgi:hypothetical protein
MMTDMPRLRAEIDRLSALVGIDPDAAVEAARGRAGVIPPLDSYGFLVMLCMIEALAKRVTDLERGRGPSAEIKL